MQRQQPARNVYNYLQCTFEAVVVGGFHLEVHVHSRRSVNSCSSTCSSAAFRLKVIWVSLQAMSWGPWGPRRESKGSSVSPRAESKRSVSPLSRWSSARQAVERTVKTATAVNALARSNSPRPQPVGTSVVEWADHKQPLCGPK